MQARYGAYADANIFMRPFEIYRAALYNVYGGSRVTDVPYIIIIGASLSKPHIDEVNARNPYTSDMQGLFGASLS